MKQERIKGSDGRRGPKGDPGQARAAILSAARSEFGRRGYEGATMRAIAAAAEVDVALVGYYFGTKSDLFVASLELPVNPADVLAEILAQDMDDAAERLLAVLLKVWDQPVTGAPLIAMLRSLATQAAVLREFIGRHLISPLAAAIPGPASELRAAAFTSQILGLVLERYVLEIEPLASATHEQLIVLMAPSLQRHLDAPTGRT
jgi:AcrR family transcriptional regulator